MDLNDFDVEKTTEGAWASFTENLAEVLSVMDDTSDLTISAASTMEEDAAVRFSSDGKTVTARVIGGGAGLTALGWTESDKGHTASADQEDTEALARLTSRTMQEVFNVIHPVFLEPDQLKEILSGDPQWTELSSSPSEREAQPAVMPASRADLDRIVDEQLERLFGHPPLRNPQGDVGLRVGSTMVFLRSTPDASEIVVFSPLVHEVAGRSRACEVLNDINVESRYGRFALHRDRVYVQVSVQANPFVAAHLEHALHVVSQIADGIDDDLAEKLGGRTTFPSQ